MNLITMMLFTWMNLFPKYQETCGPLTGLSPIQQLQPEI